MLSGAAYGKVRAMMDDRGERVKTGWPVYSGRDPRSESMCRMPVRYLWQQTVIKKQEDLQRHTLTQSKDKLIGGDKSQECTSG